MAHLNALLLKVITIYVEVFEVSTIARLQNKGTALVNLNHDAKFFLESYIELDYL